MKDKYNAVFERIRGRIVDDSYRYFFQMAVIPAILGCISLGMFVINLITHQLILAAATSIFGAANLLNAILVWQRKKDAAINYVLFFLGIFFLFLYFLITGGTAGFSPSWICILPACGFMMVGLKRGTFVCTMMFLIIVFLLDTQAGQAFLMYDYTPEFRMRFPMVYCSCFVLGYVFEWIRLVTNRELVKLQEKYRVGMNEDQLTRLHNRYWIDEKAEHMVEVPEEEGMLGVMIIDIDYFKRINDRFGHLVGDRVLQRIASEIRSLASEDLCRWGGEEFVFFDTDTKEWEFLNLAEKIRASVEKMDIGCGKESLTLSIGVAFAEKENICLRAVIEMADRELYRAKQNGRNQVCCAPKFRVYEGIENAAEA